MSRSYSKFAAHKYGCQCFTNMKRTHNKRLQQWPVSWFIYWCRGYSSGSNSAVSCQKHSCNAAALPPQLCLDLQRAAALKSNHSYGAQTSLNVTCIKCFNAKTHDRNSFWVNATWTGCSLDSAQPKSTRIQCSLENLDSEPPESTQLGLCLAWTWCHLSLSRAPSLAPPPQHH